MNKLTVTLIFLLVAFILSNSKIFSQNNQYFTNPILAGFYPDPSICKVEDNYYLVNSTFSFFPGIPIFQSKDLVNWKLLGHVLDRPEQLNLDGQGVSRGLFAPAIRYNKDIFYVTCTLVDIGGNFVVTSISPEGPWSNPVWLPEINGIDPSFYFDDDGKSYIIYNSDAPDNKPLYQGHRTIRIVEFDIEAMRITSEGKILVNGGVDISKKPIWIEGPHIYKVNGTYYLTAAEGGTAEDHSQTIFRSEKVYGPYTPYEKNPILTQKNLDPNRTNAVTCTGHADFVETDSGDWWAVFLACRPFTGNHYNTGRETFLAPVKWIDGWPVINPDYEEVKYFYPYPLPPQKDFAVRQYSGNFRIRDNFDKADLDKNWLFLRTPHEEWYEQNSEKTVLSLKLRPETCAGNMNPSFLGHRQQHMICSASTGIEFTPASSNEKAGLLIFLNETHFYYLCKSIENGNPVIQLYKSTDSSKVNDEMELVASRKISIQENNSSLHLQIKAEKNTYSFYYAFTEKNDETEWNLLKDNVDATFLSVRIPRDFTGCVFALYATSLGKVSAKSAYYNYFDYSGNDELY